MALQTRFAELFRSGRKSQTGAATEPPASSEPQSGARESAPPPPTGYRSEPAPRLSLTQFVNGPTLLRAANDGAAQEATFGPGEAWEHIAGGEAVNWWLREGSGAAGSRALEHVMAQLAVRSGFHDRWERLGEVRCVVAELAPLLGALEVAPVLRELLAVGLGPARTIELRTLVLAFIQLEATGAELDSDAGSVIERACALRAELVAACTWNLRGRRELGNLGRITDSARSSELALDLTELADLLFEHEDLFTSDHSFNPTDAAERAINLACKLRGEQLQSAPCASHEWGLRTQVFSLLMECVVEIQAAAIYGLRHMPNWARAFGPLRNVSRRRSRLRDSLSV